MAQHAPGCAGRYLPQDASPSVVKVVSPEKCCQPGYFLNRPENPGKFTGGSSGLREDGDAKGVQMFHLRSKIHVSRYASVLENLLSD
ncbi:protein of unknown function [Pseudomonas sp. JV551A1]|nr:protein of unknown function [Pseudomonas sp. JV551A1]